MYIYICKGIYRVIKGHVRCYIMHRAQQCKFSCKEHRILTGDRDYLLGLAFPKLEGPYWGPIFMETTNH